MKISEFLIAKHYLGSIVHIRLLVGFRDKRYGARCSWICLNDIHYIVFYGKLHIDKPYRIECSGYFMSMIFYLLQYKLTQVEGWQGSVTVA